MFTFLLATVLLLDGGTRIEGEIVERANGRVIVRTTTGVLYSVPESSIRSEFESRPPSATTTTKAAVRVVPPRRLPESKIKVSDEEKNRLLAELSKNHSGKEAPKQSWEIPKPEPAEAEIEVTERSDESYWREESRKRDEAVRRATEQYELLTRREREIEDTVRMMLASGVNPDHMGYQMMALADTRTMRAQARLAIESAKRHRDALHEDARREGILPGWLR